MKVLLSTLTLLFLLILFPAAYIDALPSDNLIIMQVQTGGSGSGTATEEFVLLFNQSNTSVNVTGWCVVYSSAADNVGFKSCIIAPDNLTEIWVEPGGLISFSTAQFTLANNGFVPDFELSGGLAGTSGHIRLFDEGDIEIDKVAWGSAVSPEGLVPVDSHVSGEVLSRDAGVEVLDTDSNVADFSSQQIISSIVSGVYEQSAEVDACLNIDGVQLVLPDGYLLNDNEECFEDFCLNIEGLQIVAPDGYHKLDDSIDCVLILDEDLENSVILITELLINVPSYDTGLEYIELYNPGNSRLELSGYRLQLGLSYSKEFIFASGSIDPGQYLVFSDTETGIVLPNSSSASIRLVAPFGNTVSESAVYSNSNDDVSWALVEDVWIYTNQTTPGSANKPYLLPAVDEVLGVTSIFAPCPVGKYRNTETNRCRNIETAVSILAPCKANELRNPETNRCRKISTTSQLKPCASDEYRSPDTNRCRKNTSASSSLASCPAGQERNPETNRCRKISVLGIESDITKVVDIRVESTEGQMNWWVIMTAIAGTVSYMVYEWRFELSRYYRFKLSSTS